MWDRLNRVVMGTPERQRIALFTLGTVLFPGGRLDLRVFEPRYMDMAKHALKTSTPFGIVLIREGAEVGAPAIPDEIGTLATISDWDMAQLGVLQIRVHGGARFRIVHYAANAAGLLMAEVELLGEDSACELEMFRPTVEFLQKVLMQSVPPPAEPRWDDAAWVSFRLTEILPLPTKVKQKMLALTETRLRLDILQRFLISHNLVPR